MEGLIEEHKRVELLRSHNLEPRNRVLLDGPPGNGKTTLAEAIATETMLPFYVVRYEGIVSSFLGETTARLDHAFEFARTRRCVLFFDEVDTIAKERSDTHETGRSSVSCRRCFSRSTGCPLTSSWCAPRTTRSSLIEQLGDVSNCALSSSHPHAPRQQDSSRR